MQEIIVVATEMNVLSVLNGYSPDVVSVLYPGGMKRKKQIHVTWKSL